MKNVLSSTTSLLLGLFVLFAVSACTDLKEELKIDRQKSNHTSSAFDYGCNAHYEYGKKHNMGVEHVMEYQEEFLALAEDESALKALVAEKTEEFLNTVEMEDPDYSSSTNIDWESFNEVDLTNNASILEAADLTAYEKQILATYFDQLPGFDLTTDDGLTALINFTENLECSLLDDEEITNQAGIFTCLAVTKYSASYWTNDSDLPQTEGIIGIIVSDAFGALFGYKGDKKKRGKRMLGFAIAFSATMGLAILI
jgi:hypothetical protein